MMTKGLARLQGRVCFSVKMHSQRKALSRKSCCTRARISLAMSDAEVVSFPDPSKGGVSVAVVVRAKPPSPADSPVVVSMTKKSTTIRMPGVRKNKTAEKTYNFDRCYWSVNKTDPDYASQDVVFAEVCLNACWAACFFLNCQLCVYGRVYPPFLLKRMFSC